MQKVRFKTEDGLEIVGNFFPAEKNDAPAVVLLHMMPETKESWNNFAVKLNQEGFECLAIDLRGHGESQGGPVGSKSFSDAEHMASINDVVGAVGFFIDKGIPIEKISLVGASIGANLSITFQSEHPQIKSSILLSPGLNYRGVETEHTAKKIKEDQAIYLVAGGEGDDYSTETVKKLYNLASCHNKEIKVFGEAGHGTDILEAEPGLANEIIDWLKKIYF
jgi:dienelactone hydrolase